SSLSAIGSGTTRSSKRGCSVERQNPLASGIRTKSAIGNLTPVNETGSRLTCQFRSRRHLERIEQRVTIFDDRSALRPRSVSPGLRLVARSVGGEALRLCLARAQRSHRAARRDHSFRAHCAFAAGADAGQSHRTRLAVRRTATRARYRSTASAGGTHFWLGPIISLKPRGDAALHRRL